MLFWVLAAIINKYDHVPHPANVLAIKLIAPDRVSFTFATDNFAVLSQMSGYNLLLAAFTNH
jgi:hypothetical protein